MRCKNCRHINPIDSLFCENCGQRLPTEEFCGHCGKKIAGTECFCPHCGKAILGRNASAKELGEKIKQGMDDAVEKLNTSNKTILNNLRNEKKAVFLFISNVVMGLLMLLNWVKSDGLENLGSFVGDFSGSATLFSLSKLLSDLGELISNETLSEIGMLIIAATVIALILYAFSLITLFKKEKEKTIVLLRNGCIITIFMVVSMIACVIYVNADIKEMSYGFVSNCFSLTASPIIAAVFGLFLIFFGLKKIKETEEV